MRKSIVAIVALTAVLHAGCFTVVGATVGGIADAGSHPAPSPPPAPVQVTGAPGSTALSFTSNRQVVREDAGMSGLAKGALIGVSIDTLLTVALFYALSQMDDDWGCGDCE